MLNKQPVNYIADNSNLEQPPPYWLQRLYDFDSQLVVFPSRYRPGAYVLARRQRVSTRTQRDRALEDTITQPDTKFCLANALVPVCLIYKTGTIWSLDNIIATLKRRDTWEVGGADKAADLLDQGEAAEEAANAKATRDDMWARSGQGWESYQRRTGQRVTSPGIGQERNLPKTSPSGSTVESGIVLTDS